MGIVNWAGWVIDPKPNEQIYISGHRYAQALLKKISYFCASRCAKPSLNLFSDADIINANDSGFWVPSDIRSLKKFSKYILHTPYALSSADGYEPYFKRVCSILSRQRINTILLDYPEAVKLRRFYDKAIDLDYKKLSRTNMALKKLLEAGERIRITCPRQTDLIMRRGNRKVSTENCRFEDEPFFQLPGGEVFFSPFEKSTSGKVCVNGRSLGLPGYFSLDVKVGAVKEVHGNYSRSILAKIRSVLGIPKELVGELGVGTNPNVKIKGPFSIYEKMASTAHIGIGENIYYGGSNKSERHIDLVIDSPTIHVGDILVMKDGKIQL